MGLSKACWRLVEVWRVRFDNHKMCRRLVQVRRVRFHFRKTCWRLFVGVSTGVFSQKHMKEKPDTLTCDRVIKTALVMFSDAPVHNLKNPSAEREERHTL